MWVQARTLREASRASISLCEIAPDSLGAAVRMQEGLMHWTQAGGIGKSQDWLTVAHFPHRKETRTQKEPVTHPGHTGQGTKQGPKPQSHPMAGLLHAALLGCTGEKKLLQLECDFSFLFFLLFIFMYVFVCAES